MSQPIQLEEVEILGAIFGDHPAVGEALGDASMLDVTDETIEILADPEWAELHEILSGPGDEEDLLECVGFPPIDQIKSVAKSAGKLVKKVVKSPITKMAAGGLAIAFPAVGIPAAGALAVADRAIRVAEGTKGTPKQQKAMKKAIVNTGKLALKGDKGAKSFLDFAVAAKALRNQQAKHGKAKGPAEEGYFVNKRSGRINRGKFARA